MSNSVAFVSSASVSGLRHLRESGPCTIPCKFCLSFENDGARISFRLWPQGLRHDKSIWLKRAWNDCSLPRFLGQREGPRSVINTRWCWVRGAAEAPGSSAHALWPQTRVLPRFSPPCDRLCGEEEKRDPDQGFTEHWEVLWLAQGTVRPWLLRLPQLGSWQQLSIF